MLATASSIMLTSQSQDRANTATFLEHGAAGLTNHSGVSKPFADTKYVMIIMLRAFHIHSSESCALVP